MPPQHIRFDETRHGSFDPWSDNDDDGGDNDGDNDVYPDLALDEDDDLVAARSVRFPKTRLSPDPAVWLANNLMTRTEVALRLARHLLTSHLATGDVRICLTGHEALVRNRPRFPVAAFLRERGCERSVEKSERSTENNAPYRSTNEWRGRYMMKGVPHALVLHSDPDHPDVIAPLTNGARLVAHVNRGTLAPTQSPGEHKLLRAALGRALTYPRYEASDLGAAVVPRSPRFRALANEWRRAPALVRAGLLILTVDRVGNIEGLNGLSLGQ